MVSPPLIHNVQTGHHVIFEWKTETAFQNLYLRIAFTIHLDRAALNNTVMLQNNSLFSVLTGLKFKENMLSFFLC